MILGSRNRAQTTIEEEEKEERRSDRCLPFSQLPMHAHPCLSVVLALPSTSLCLECMGQRLYLRRSARATEEA